MSEEKNELKKAVKILIEGSHYFALNMNDTFAYACADVEEMVPEEFEKIIPIIAKYGHDALTAYAAYKRHTEPIHCKCCHDGPEYQEAKKAIADILEE